MLTAADLETLEAGDMVEADPVFSGLCNEPLVLKVKTNDPDKKLAVFDALYFNVAIGEWKADYAKEGVLWQTA